jgi:hypothetical protein
MMAMMSGGDTSAMGGGMRGMGRGMGADDMRGAAGAQTEFSCCPPSPLSTMMQGPLRWLPMLLGTLLLLSIIALFLALAFFFVRRSRVGVPARA